MQRCFYVLGSASGTAALFCGLHGLGTEPGDEVIVPAYIWIVLASAALAVGAISVVVEADKSLTLKPGDVETHLSPAVRDHVGAHVRRTCAHGCIDGCRAAPQLQGNRRCGAS